MLQYRTAVYAEFMGSSDAACLMASTQVCFRGCNATSSIVEQCSRSVEGA